MLHAGYITEEQYNEGCRILAESDHREYTPWTQQAKIRLCPIYGLKTLG